MGVTFGDVTYQKGAKSFRQGVDTFTMEWVGNDVSGDIDKISGVTMHDSLPGSSLWQAVKVVEACDREYELQDTKQKL